MPGLLHRVIVPGDCTHMWKGKEPASRFIILSAAHRVIGSANKQWCSRKILGNAVHIDLSHRFNPTNVAFQPYVRKYNACHSKFYEG